MKKSDSDVEQKRAGAVVYPGGGSLGEPFVFPDVDQLEVKNGMPILPKIPGRVITMEMVKALCEG